MLTMQTYLHRMLNMCNVIENGCTTTISMLHLSLYQESIIFTLISRFLRFLNLRVFFMKMFLVCQWKNYEIQDQPLRGALWKRCFFIVFKFFLFKTWRFFGDKNMSQTRPIHHNPSPSWWEKLQKQGYNFEKFSNCGIQLGLANTLENV